MDTERSFRRPYTGQRRMIDRIQKSGGLYLGVTDAARGGRDNPASSSQMKMKLSWLSGLQRHGRRADVIVQRPLQPGAVAAFQRVRRPTTPWPRQRLPRRRRIATD